jgi:uncharacterized sporulation protein YeaH/YhbH (DUF444 family)
LTKEEFMELFFEDLALPRLLRNHIGNTLQYKTRRAGYSHDGTPSNLALVRTMRGALGRRIALTKAPHRELKVLEEQLETLLAQDDGTSESVAELQRRIDTLRERIGAVPFLEQLDLRFRNRSKVPVPSSQAVMFCVMDVSGSMDQERKELAKRFFILLYLFLTRHYDKIEIVFIRHHTQAEVSEDEFFHSTESGGTVVSSALVLLEQIIRARYPVNDWNIYVAQASDGDNFSDDGGKCQLLAERILPLVRYYAYLQVVLEEQTSGKSTAACCRCSRISPCARYRQPTRSTRCSAISSRRMGYRYEPQSLSRAGSQRQQKGRKFACQGEPRFRDVPHRFDGVPATGVSLARPQRLDFRADRTVSRGDCGHG